MSRLVRWSLLLCVLVGWSVSGVLAQDQPKVVTLGADLTPEQRQALLQTFGAREGTDTILTVDTTEMRASMQDIIPVPEGYTSVSSTALTCGAAGSGLRVTTENITRVSAGMYAGALLTAGIGDAEFIVAAPADAQAEGMTALTGIFKGFEGGACGRGEIEPARRELAYRWLATTERLAGATGDETAAANLMLRAQEKVVEGGSDPAGSEPALDAAASESGVAVPADQRAGLVELLRGMAEAKIDWGTYASGWEVQQVSPNEVRLTATNLQPGAEATAAAGGAAPAGAAAGTTVQGTLRAPIVAGAPFTVEVDGQPRELMAGDGAIPVTRDGQPAQLADIQPGDSVTLRLRPDSVVEAIDARSADAANAGGEATNTAGRFVVGMVEANTNGQINLQTGGATREFAVPAAARVVREGREAQVGAVQARDSAVMVLDATGQVEAVFARPGAGAYAVEGVAPGAVNGQTLAVEVGEQTIAVPLANGAVPVTRDGRAAQLADIQANDRVTIRFDESNQPVAIDAQSPVTGFNWRRLWWLPLLLLPLLLLPLVRRGRTQTVVVEPGQRTVVDAANPGKAIDQARDGQPTHRTRS